MTKILVLGAGGVGGYFGGRLAEAGADVTFLLRPASADLIRTRGLCIRSPCGDMRVFVKVVTAEQCTAPYDVVLLCCKAYDLDAAIRDITPAVGPTTAVLPLLNGLDHLLLLDAAFGRERVLGGVCYISVGRGPGGELVHFTGQHELIFGTRAGPDTARRLYPALVARGFRVRLSNHVLADLWDKYVFITTLAAATCLMRADIGIIMDTDFGENLLSEMLSECQSVARAHDHPIRPDSVAFARRVLTARGSCLTSSLLRDILTGSRTEAQQLVGSMVGRATVAGVVTPLLRAAWSHLQAYERYLLSSLNVNKQHTRF